MSTTRRDFLRVGAAGATLLGFDITPAYAESRALKISRTTETRSTCPYCSVSCGVIIHTEGDKSKNVRPFVVHVEGDPDHPINQGSLCSKGITLKSNIVNDRRLTKVQYRAPGLGGREVAIRHPLLEDGLRGFPMHRRALGLAILLVPSKIEPAQPIENGIERRLRIALDVGIVDAQDHRAAVMARV